MARVRANLGLLPPGVVYKAQNRTYIKEKNIKVHVGKLHEKIVKTAKKSKKLQKTLKNT